MLNIWRMGNINQQQTSTLNTGNQQTPTSLDFPSTSCTLSQVSSGGPAYVVRNAMPLPVSCSGVYISQNVSNFISLILNNLNFIDLDFAELEFTCTVTEFKIIR